MGERTNVLGSRRFRRLIAEGAYEEGAELGRRQVRNGAHLLDVCLQDPDRDETADMIAFLDLLTKKVKTPIMIDSTDVDVIEVALKRLQGKSVINSINLEDGETRFQAVVPLARRYGAALVVGCIDEDKEQAQAVTRQRKLEVAIRSFQILTEKYGVPPEDIISIPWSSGRHGRQKLRRVGSRNRRRGPANQGSPTRYQDHPGDIQRVLRSAHRRPRGAQLGILYHCVQAGLDMAIVNAELMQRYTSIPEEERKLAEDLMWDRGEDPVAAFAVHFRDRPPKPPDEERQNLPLDERLALAIIEGTKEGLAEDLDEALVEREPLEIINGPLMAGMTEVGPAVQCQRIDSRRGVAVR